MSFSSSSSSGSERKKDVVVVVVSDVLKDVGGFDDDPVVARLPRLNDFWTRLLLLDISKLKVLFPRHHRLAVASPSSSSPLLSPSARRNRLAGVLYAKGGSKGSRHRPSAFLFSVSSFVNTTGRRPKAVVVFPDDDDKNDDDDTLTFLSSSFLSTSTMNCHRSQNVLPGDGDKNDKNDDDDDAWCIDRMCIDSNKSCCVFLVLSKGKNFKNETPLLNLGF